MPIRSVEEFDQELKKADLTKKKAGLTWAQSKYLEKVQNCLSLYHKKKTIFGEFNYPLLELSDSLAEWKKQQPIEFGLCHGSALLSEVELELKAMPAQKQEEHPLFPGDILFRYVPTDSTQRKTLQNVISGAQEVQVRGVLGEIGKLLFTHKNQFFKNNSSTLLQHVGIYVGAGCVREIGPGGLRTNSVEGVEREHYDLVVRTKFGNRITHQAYLAQHGPEYRGEKPREKIPNLLSPELAAKSHNVFIKASQEVLKKGSDNYPANDLLTVSLCPAKSWTIMPAKAQALRDKNREYYGKGGFYRLQQRVICSHFVYAVLYAASSPEKRCLATATDHKFDEIFKVSPAQMWREFLQKEGLWRDAGAKWVGIQHKGILYRHINGSTLQVGLKGYPDGVFGSGQN